MENAPARRQTDSLASPLRSGRLSPLAKYVGDLFDEFSRDLFEHAFGRPRGLTTQITDEEFRANIQLAGLDEKDHVHVTQTGNEVFVRAESADGCVGYNYSFSIPHWAKEISAEMKNGVLFISAPRPEELRPREIPVRMVRPEEEEPS